MEGVNDMPKSNMTKGARKRVRVKDLPAAEKKLTGKQMKKITGGGVAIDILDRSNTRKPEGTGGTAVVSLGKLG